MKDERIQEKEHKIKRNNVIILLGISLLACLIKLLIGDTIGIMYTEIFVASASVLTILLAYLYRLSQQVVDERIEQNILRIYNYGFNIIVFSAFLIYYAVSNFSLADNRLLPNTYMNIAIMVCILFTFINIRKNDMTFNYTFIESGTRDYYISVMKRILYLFVGAIIISAVVYLVRGTQANWLVIQVGIILSFLNFSIIYFLFSIYERIHYLEQVEVEAGILRYVSRKALFLFILIFLFNTQKVMIELLFKAIEYNLISLSISNSLIFAMLYLSNLIRSFDYVILALIMNLIIYRSIVRLRLYFPKYFSVIKVMIIIGFAVNMLMAVYSLVFRVLSFFVEYEQVIMISKIFSIINIAYIICSFIVEIVIVVFMVQNSIPILSLYITSVGLSILTIVSSLLTPRILIVENTLEGYFYANIVSMILGLIHSVLILIIIYRLSNITQISDLSHEETGYDLELSTT